FGHLGDQFDRAHVGLFPKLAPRRIERRLALVDSALRHLPSADVQNFAASLALAMADEGLPVAVGEDDADTGAVGELMTHGFASGLNSRPALRHFRVRRLVME